jgi:hypothetical protein
MLVLSKTRFITLAPEATPAMFQPADLGHALTGREAVVKPVRGD